MRPCRLFAGLDKARHVVPAALPVRVQCLRESLYMAVEGPSTRPIVFSMIPGSNCRRRRRMYLLVHFSFNGEWYVVTDFFCALITKTSKFVLLPYPQNLYIITEHFLVAILN